MNEIDNYFKEKALLKKQEELTAWQNFYLQNNNDWKAELVSREIENL